MAKGVLGKSEFLTITSFKSCPLEDNFKTSSTHMTIAWKPV